MSLRFNPGRSFSWIGDVNESNLRSAAKRILALSTEDRKAPIFLLLKTDGGDMDAGFAFYHLIRRLTTPLVSIAIGEVASMGLILLMSGSERIALPHSTFLLHEPQMENLEDASVAKMNKETANLKRDRARYIRIISTETKQRALSRPRIEKLMSEEKILDAREALRIGLIHRIWKSKAIR